MSSPGLVTLGETMGLVVQAGVGQPLNGETMTFRMGGSESNVAIGVRRLGLAATWAGRLGPDPAGALIRRELRAEQVRALVTEDPAATGLMVRWRPAAGRGHVTYHRRDSAGSHLAPGDLPAAEVAAARVLHATGITLALGAGPAAALTEAIATARAVGTLVSFDLNYRRALWPAELAVAALRPVLGDCDIAFAGLDEARMVTGGDGDAEAVARAIEALGPRHVLITLGADGCVARLDGTTYTVPAPRMAVIDTVGAGDAFVAGYLAELMLDAQPATRLSTAVRAGALAVTAPGDWEGMPGRPALAQMASTEPVIR